MDIYINSHYDLDYITAKSRCPKQIINLFRGDWYHTASHAQPIWNYYNNCIYLHTIYGIATILYDERNPIALFRYSTGMRPYSLQSILDCIFPINTKRCAYKPTTSIYTMYWVFYYSRNDGRGKRAVYCKLNYFSHAWVLKLGTSISLNHSIAGHRHLFIYNLYKVEPSC